MTAKIFLTGATGYVGGGALVEFLTAHPDFDYTLFVRSEAKAATVRAGVSADQAARLHFVYGDNDNTDVIRATAAVADVVIHTANSADHVGSAEAIVTGLAEGHSAEHPGVYIHVSGSGLLTWYDLKHKRVGESPLPAEQYDDWDGVERLVTGVPDDALHRDVDKRLQQLAAQYATTLRLAIVSPPTIYGVSRGPDNHRSVQIPSLANYMLKRGYAPLVGKGLAMWNNVHVADVGRLLVRLAEAGLDPTERASSGDKHSIWGTHAYYFVENGTFLWADASRWLAAAAVDQGLISAAADGGLPLKQVDLADITAADAPGNPLVNFTWATNSIGSAQRARKLLGWEPKEKTLKEEINATLADEVALLGITKH